MRSGRSARVRVLVDTSALLALARSRDEYHQRAVRIADRHLTAGGRFVGTTLVLAELHAHLLYLRGIREARTALERLLNDPIHEWVEVSADLVREAAGRWLARFADHDLTLADAVSFEVMRTRRLRRAFAFDHHFEIAGFELLS
jgi:uncharacterized protein